MIDVEYKKVVLQKVVDHKIGTIDVHPVKNRSFIEAVKIIIDWGQDLENGFVLEFNDHYTKLLKRKIRKPFKQQQNAK